MCANLSKRLNHRIIVELVVVAFVDFIFIGHKLGHLRTDKILMRKNVGEQVGVGKSLYTVAIFFSVQGTPGL